MNNNKENKHLGVYGILIKNEKGLLIEKKGGPYDGKLDLPGGGMEFKETPLETLKREFQEEVGLKVIKAKLIDADSLFFTWKYDNTIITTHHIGIFYQIIKYQGTIKEKKIIDSQNDDALGAKYYEINLLKKKDLSKITILELEKLGYKLK